MSNKFQANKIIGRIVGDPSGLVGFGPKVVLEADVVSEYPVAEVAYPFSATITTGPVVGSSFTGPTQTRPGHTALTVRAGQHTEVQFPPNPEQVGTKDWEIVPIEGLGAVAVRTVTNPGNNKTVAAPGDQTSDRGVTTIARLVAAEHVDPLVYSFAGQVVPRNSGAAGLLAQAILDNLQRPAEQL